MGFQRSPRGPVPKFSVVQGIHRTFNISMNSVFKNSFLSFLAEFDDLDEELQSLSLSLSDSTAPQRFVSEDRDRASWVVDTPFHDVTVVRVNDPMRELLIEVIQDSRSSGDNAIPHFLCAFQNALIEPLPLMLRDRPRQRYEDSRGNWD